LVVEYYELEEDIELTICIRYMTHVGVNRTRTWVRLCEHERIEDQQTRTEKGVQQQLTIDNAKLFCYLQWGMMVEQEMNCNSQYMLEKMPIIGAEIHHKMPFIPQDTTINLIMDNAGGHGMQ
jgi:hypothetical protein